MADTKIIDAMNQCDVEPEKFEQIENTDNIYSEDTTSVDSTLLYINVQIDATARDVLLVMTKQTFKWYDVAKQKKSQQHLQVYDMLCVPNAIKWLNLRNNPNK